MATGVPVISAPLSCPLVPPHFFNSLEGEVVNVENSPGEKVSIDLLIGLDSYWRFFTGETVKLSQHLIAQKSIFGWIVSGVVPVSETSFVSHSHQLFCLSDFSEKAAHSFWDLESVGVAKDESSFSDDHLMKQFENSVVHLASGRYEVSLPWKNEFARGCLLENESQSRKRLNNTSRKLAKTPTLEKQYHGVFSEYLENGFIEQVEDIPNVSELPHPVYYMPHRPVIKEGSASTKIRPVFDASSKGYNGISLNDCLEAGPSLIPNLIEILIRFRRWPVAVCADIIKAFLQIQVKPEDRDVHRFLWNDMGTVKTMRFTRVPFGNKCSPFLLNATVKHHLSQYPTSHVVDELNQNLYVDDLISGCDDEIEACAFIREADSIMQQASMKFSKWVSNSDTVGELLSQEFSDRSVTEKMLKVLGIQWMPTEDCFYFDGLELSSDAYVTKRVILSYLARLFDPLGLLAPFIVVLKCLFQSLWRLHLDWDEIVPDIIAQQFKCWLQGLHAVRGWRIPRCYTVGHWNDVEVYQLHAFGDASEKAYGACVYLRTLSKDGIWRTSLVYSKTRVAPLKPITLPRLELLAALLAAKLLSFVRDSLHFSANVPYTCWTDSTIVLSWIKSDPRKWKTFVSNRISEIQSLTDPSQWLHCTGNQNPADLLSRGISGPELCVSETWLHGPVFLREIRPKISSMKTVSESDVNEGVVISEMKSNPVLLKFETPDVVFQFEKWSTFTKTLRIMAWVLRFIGNLKASKEAHCTEDLTLMELQEAKVHLISVVQRENFSEEIACVLEKQSVSKKSPLFKLSPFIDGDGLLRVKGRLQFSHLSYEAKHPIILPKGHFSLLLIRHLHNTLKHAGVNSLLVRLRDEYWITGARRMCKRVKRECITCQRLDTAVSSQPVPPLPSMRVNTAPPFSVSGLDHGGPLFCCDTGSKKFYILLITCAVTRAVHLELVCSLSAEETLNAIRRFVARRGMPSVIISDNARGFVAAKKLVLQYFGSNSPKWQFIVPLAPWWGGWWERLMGSVKSSLKKTIGTRSLTRSELEITLFEIEACINSRPLTFVADDVEDRVSLTPSHFLVGRLLTSGPLNDLEEIPDMNNVDLVAMYDHRNQLLNKFWEKWSSEYIRNLPSCQSSVSGRKGLNIGSVVLVRDQNSPRLLWPLGVVQRVFPGRDGLVRSVEVKTSKGLITRPIQKLHDLEISSGVGLESLPVEPELDDQGVNISTGKQQFDTDHALSPNNTTETETAQYSRYGRKIKKPTILDL
ncbi:uncharacterized protein LOC106159196 [Lingula anatina]|uniref:Uncharacterized protein LOC106159196 n=1 Tax=Lingula anatina TaxID=7574 RepID=A0A1S3HXV7_LINAN|nr:uncharacterized protein LOC106159196 [Lingula anatina]|eukprot:XP_013390867.1 uncharacterized protein LOC106159196 [Lingula anatina]